MTLPLSVQSKPFENIQSNTVVLRQNFVYNNIQKQKLIYTVQDYGEMSFPSSSAILRKVGIKMYRVHRWEGSCFFRIRGFFFFGFPDRLLRRVVAGCPEAGVAPCLAVLKRKQGLVSHQTVVAVFGFQRVLPPHVLAGHRVLPGLLEAEGEGDSPAAEADLLLAAFLPRCGGGRLFGVALAAHGG